MWTSRKKSKKDNIESIKQFKVYETMQDGKIGLKLRDSKKAATRWLRPTFPSLNSQILTDSTSVQSIAAEHLERMLVITNLTVVVHAIHFLGTLHLGILASTAACSAMDLFPRIPS